MLDLAHLLHLVSFILGLITLFYLAMSRLPLGRQYVFLYASILVSINIISLGHLSESYFKIRTSLDPGFINLELFLSILLLILSLSRIFFSWAFIGFTQLLKGKKKRLILNCSFAGMGILVLSALLTAFFSGDSLREKLEWITASFCHLVMFISLIYGAISVFRHARRKPHHLEKKWIQVFLWFWIAYALTLAITRLLGYTGLILLNGQLFLFGVITLILNILHLTFLHRFTNDVNHFIRDNAFEERFLRYGLSSREGEVVKLICRGMTNKEIGEVLFISPLTVRDHTSHIFAKTNTKNRSQLAGLFSGNEPVLRPQ